MACLIIFLETYKLLWVIIAVVNHLWKPRSLIIIQVVQMRILQALMFEPLSFK